MKKILLAFDGQNFSEGAFEFARRLNEKQPILLTGIFLPQVDYSNYWSYAVGIGNTSFTPPESNDTEEMEKNIEHFEQLCIGNDIAYRVRKDFVDLAIPELKKETRFADLLILGSEQFYKNVGIGEPNDYLRDAIHASECPILIVPEKFAFPESNVLAYDGSESSVYAIKQFAYLFPELIDNKTLLVFAKENDRHLPDEESIIELAARHFNDLTITKLDMDPKKYFTTWLSEVKNCILVSGAFGRSAFSELFRKSFVSDIIREHKLPVFITHS